MRKPPSLHDQKSPPVSKFLRYSQSIFSLSNRPKFSDFFDLCLHGLFIVRGKETWGFWAKVLVHMGRDVNSDKSCMRKNGQNCTLWARDVRMLGQNGRRVDLHRCTVQRRKIVGWLTRKRPVNILCLVLRNITVEWVIQCIADVFAKKAVFSSEMSDSRGA